MKYLVYTLTTLFCTGIFLPLKAQQESDFLNNTRQLIYEGKRSGEGYWSSDGTQIIFQSERDEKNPFYQIYTLDFTTGEVQRVSPGIGKTTCAYFNWGNNDKEVMYGSTHHDPKAKEKMQEEIDFRNSGKARKYSWDYDPTMDIFKSDADGSNIVQLTDAKGYDAEGSFSPNGKYIAFSSTRTAYEGKLSEEEAERLKMDPSYFGEIYIMNADGSNLKRLTNSPGYDGGPFFSPDGERIVWRRFTADGHSADVFTMNLDGSDVKRITDFKAMSWAPYFHPTGEYIIFASNKLGFANFELYIVDREGKKEPQRITYTDGFDGLPVFSPDGSKLLWTSNRTGNETSQLFLANWNHNAALKALENAPARGEGKGIAFTPSIDARELEQKVEYLASDELEGRMTGSQGIELAANYLIDEFKALGLDPIDEDYRSPFTFIKSIELADKGNSFTYKKGRKDETVKLYDDYIPMSFSGNGAIEGELVFAGYGLSAPDGSGVEYDDYANLDVEGKIVMVLDDMPDFFNEKEEKAMVRYVAPRFKSVVAKEKGAKGIIFISQRQTPFTGPGQQYVAQQAGIVAVKVQKPAADALLKKGGKSLKDVQKAFENYNPHSENTFATGVDIDLEVTLNKVEGEDDNIMAILPANNSDEYIMIGGHLDHLGYGEVGSRASGEALHTIHNGADDNASGTATVMELAEYFADLEEKNPGTLKYNLVFALWSGEEMGLIGSTRFVESKTLDMDKVTAYLNFDMVGMLDDNQLVLQGLGSSEEWRSIAEKKNFMAGFNLSLQDDPYVPTDGMALYQAEVPILCFFTGIHDHYHMPSDDAGNLNYEGMARIGNYAKDILMELNSMEPLPYEKVKMSASKSAANRGFSVYLGTIPDYTAQVKGVKLSGVRDGGPAANAGLKGGDIITHLAGKQLNDIYDYTYALGDLEAGKDYDIVIQRDGKEKKLTITPMAK